MRILFVFEHFEESALVDLLNYLYAHVGRMVSIVMFEPEDAAVSLTYGVKVGFEYTNPNNVPEFELSTAFRMPGVRNVIIDL